MPDYTLYTLIAQDEVNQNSAGFSIHVWKTILSLNFFGQNYKMEGKTFHTISHELRKQTGNENVTVPTLRIGEKEYVTDSWKIAEYLENVHGTGERSIFPGGEGGKRFCKFIDLWTNTTFANEIRPTIYPKVYEMIDDPSRTRFSARLWPTTSDIETAIARLSDPEWCSRQYASARKQLQLIENFLNANLSSDSFLLGAKPSHADCCLFGSYAWCRTTNKEMSEAVWRHKSLPGVGRWIDGMLASGLVGVESLP